MKSGLVNSSTFQIGSLSKRRVDGSTFGLCTTLDTLSCFLSQLLQAPEEVDVLTHPHVLVVPADTLERNPAAELRGPLDHPGESRELPPTSQVQPDDQTPRSVLHLDPSSDTGRVAHSLMDHFKERD